MSIDTGQSSVVSTTVVGQSSPQITATGKNTAATTSTFLVAMGVVGFTGAANVQPTISDTINSVASGNTWTQIGTTLTGTFPALAGPNGVDLSLWLVENGNGGTNHQVLASWTGPAQFVFLDLIEITGGLTTGGILDAASSPLWNDDSATPFTSNSLTTTVAGDLLVTVTFTGASAGTEVLTWNLGFTQVNADGDTAGITGGAAKLLTTSPGTFNSSFSSSGGSTAESITALLAFKAATSASPPTITSVNSGSAIAEGQTGVAVVGTLMDATGGRTFTLVQGAVSVTQTETGTPSDTAATLTIVTEGTTSLKFGSAVLTVTRTADGGNASSSSLTVNPPSGLLFIDVGTPDTTSANRITATPDIASGDQIEARAVGGGSAPTGLTLATDGTFSFTFGNTPTAFDVRIWDHTDSTWGAWVTQSILAQPLINTQPVSQTAPVGGTCTFTVAAVSSGGSLSYQWKDNGTNVGTNSASYTTSTLSSSNNHDQITCVITDSNGNTTTNAVSIWISGIHTGIGLKSDLRGWWLRRKNVRPNSLMILRPKL